MASVYEAVLVGGMDVLHAFEPSLILDAIWLADIEPSNRNVLADTLFKLVSSQKVSIDLAKQRLDFELLEAAQLIDDAGAWNKRQIRINTAQLYKQHRFNLWREESEGYARLLVTLNQVASWNSTEKAFEELLKLIGIFNIDPNRVVDLLFDTAATRLDPSYIDLIKRFDFSPSTVAAIVGMKLGGLKENNLPEEYVEGLFLTIALAIRAKIFDLEDILPYFSQEITQRVEEREASSAMDSLTAHDTGRSIPVDSSQLLWLCASLLRINALGTFEVAMSLTRGSTWSTTLLGVICAYIKALFGCRDPMLLVYPSPDSGIDTLCYWLTKLGSTGLYHDHQLIALLIRECDINDLRWVSIIVQFVLPSLSISYGNPYLSNMLWSKLDTLHYATRFEIYARWRDINHPHTSMAVSFAKNDLRRLLRRLSKENIKQYGRLLGKLVHSNPTIIFPLLLEQCQAYDNLIPPIIESCRYLTPLAYDILTFSLLQQLKKQQDHMKDDATYVASWLQRVASFIGQLAKKYEIDLLPITEYLNDRMLDNRAVEVCILEDLLSKLGGIESRWEISDAQVETLIGGPALKAEVSPRNRKLTAKLNPLISLNTWLLLGYQRSISEDIDEEVLKLASTLFDQATSCFLQYSEYIGSCPEVVLTDPREHEVWPSLSIDSQMTIWRTWARRQQDFSFDSFSGWRQVFWGLDLGDLHVPIGRYQSEIARVKTLLITAEAKRDRECAPVVISALEGELKARIQHVQNITTHLSSLTVDAPILTFLQEAIYPRCVMSAAEATYCAKFTSFMHPQINTFSVLDALTDLLPTILVACTERETKYFGKYCAELMILMDSWHRDANKFIAEAHIKRQNLDDLIDYEEFRHMLFALHGKITASCGECIEPEGEFLRLRSSIIFLSVLTTANVFPRVDAHARALIKTIKGLKRGDAREDVKVMSVRIETSLKSVSTVKEADFHFVMDTSSGEEVKDESKEDEVEVVESHSIAESVGQRVQTMDLEDGEREAEAIKAAGGDDVVAPAKTAINESLTQQQSRDSLSQRTTSQPSSSPRETKKRSREPTPTRSEREPKRRELPPAQSQPRESSPRENLDRSSRGGEPMESRVSSTRQPPGRTRGTEQGTAGGRDRGGESQPISQHQQQHQYPQRSRDPRSEFSRDQYTPPPSSAPPSRHVEMVAHGHQPQQQRYEPSPRDLSRDWRDLRAAETQRDRRDPDKRQRDPRGQHQPSSNRYGSNRHDDDARNF